MLKLKTMEYIDDVMSNIDLPENLKIKLEKELIRYIIDASEYKSVEEVIKKLGSPEELADGLTDKLENKMSTELGSLFMGDDKQNFMLTKMPDRNTRELAPVQNNDRYIPQRLIGEFSLEESNVNIKLLYIPLIQITSGVKRIRMPLVDEYYRD